MLISTETYVSFALVVGIIVLTWSCDRSTEPKDSETAQDTLPPVVTITEPSEGELVQWVAPFRVNVEDDGEVTSVTFFVDDSLLTEITDEPYEITLSAFMFIPQDSIALSASAIDGSDNIGYSDTVTVYLRAPSYAIYSADGDTTNVDNGIWQPSLTAWKSILDTLAFDWVEVTYDEINNGIMQSGFDGLIMPGGWSGEWKNQIDTVGNLSIREFVFNGGVYVGVSAGAYYASDIVIWEGTTYDNPLNIFIGVAEGPIPEIAPWPEYTMTEVNLNQEHPINDGLGGNLTVLYFGEPYFYTLSGGNMEVVATYVYNDEPAIITFEYGEGMGLLLGPHLEIDEDSDQDGTTWGNWLYDVESDWPLLINGFYWLHEQIE